MKHISEAWNLIEASKTEEELKKVIGEIPNKFGTWSYKRTDKDTITVINDYYDESLGEIAEEMIDIDIPLKREFEYVEEYKTRGELLDIMYSDGYTDFCIQKNTN